MSSSSLVTCGGESPCSVRSDSSPNGSSSPCGRSPSVASTSPSIGASIRPVISIFIPIQNHFVWDRVSQCGLCALWNGNARGGYPAFAEVQDAALHPVVIVASLTLGAINGAKVGFIAILFIMAGIVRQWWFARELGLRTLARLWSGAMAVAAGNLSGRMEDGVYAVVVSTAAAALTLPALLRVHRDGSRRAAQFWGDAQGSFSWPDKGICRSRT